VHKVLLFSRKLRIYCYYVGDIVIFKETKRAVSF